jgi:adenylate cyclase
VADRRKTAKRRVPLSVALGGIFGLLIALAIGTVLSLSIYANFTNTLALVNGRSVAAVRQLEDAVRREFEPAQYIVAFLAQLFADGVLRFDDAEAAYKILLGSSAGDPDVGAIILYRLDNGHATGVFRGRNGNYGRIADEAVTNPMIQKELMAGAPQDQAVWGRPVIVNGQLFANVRKALVRDGETVGYAVAAVPIRLVNTRLSALGMAEGATPFILDGDSRVLVHPRLDVESALAGGRREAIGEAAMNVLAPRLALFEDDVLRRIGERETVDLFEEAAMADIEVSRLDLIDDRTIDGDWTSDRYVLMTKKTTAYSDEPWTLGLYFPAHAVNQEIQRLMRSVIAGVALLAGAVIVAVLLGRQIARPTGRFTAVADRVTALDLDDIEPLPHSRIREFDDGSQTLNRMVEALSAFSTYVPKALVAKLVSRGSRESSRPMQAELTIMFTDIAGFTGRSETMSAAETARFLNDHFAVLGDIIERSGGTIDKYLGDGLLAFWGAPEALPDHAARACAAAEDIMSTIGEHNREAVEAGGEPLRMRIGIHTGPTIVGNIGAASRVNYTVVGDSVNICARLQDLGKQVDPDAELIVLVSERTRSLAGTPERMTRLGDFQLRGREQDITVYRLKNPDGA